MTDKEIKEQIEKELREFQKLDCNDGCEIVDLCNDICLRFIEDQCDKTYLFNKLIESYKQIEKAYIQLNNYGVPKERAKTISNGISVLVTRMDKEIKYKGDDA